jgi:hypothetical protein
MECPIALSEFHPRGLLVSPETLSSDRYLYLDTLDFSAYDHLRTFESQLENPHPAVPIQPAADRRINKGVLRWSPIFQKFTMA